MAIVISILLFIICIVLACIVLLQEGKNAGLSGAISGAAETYFGKNKAHTMEGKLERITKILATCFIILALVSFFIVLS